MNKRIKALAEQAGCVLHGLVWVANDADLERFAELVRQKEREACAKLCIENAHLSTGYHHAAAIRGRTE